MSKLNEKLDKAVNEYQEIEQRLTQVNNAKIELEKALEQTRGRVAALQELVEEEGQPEPEIVDAVPVEDDNKEDSDK